jgi:hypothetical protein
MKEVGESGDAAEDPGCTVSLALPKLQQPSSMDMVLNHPQVNENSN